MDVLREREVKDSLERQLLEEQKLRGKFPDVILILNPFVTVTCIKQSTKLLITIQ